MINKHKVLIRIAPKDEIDDFLLALVDALENINENKRIAKLNEQSMLANNGGRIYF